MPARQDNPPMGTTFGAWTFIGGHKTDKYSKKYLRVRCGCGAETFASYTHLKVGRSTRCRSCANRKYDTTTRFGRLTYVRPIYKSQQSVWRCECGSEDAFNTDHVIRGLRYQCKACQATAKRRKWSERIGAYNSWYTMRARCHNPHNKSYADYGGRGIKVDPTFDTFEGFYAIMGDRPEGMTLDRIDVNGDYAPSNVRWATDTEQSKNRRRSKAVRESLGLED